jgi:hypothetical protein
MIINLLKSWDLSNAEQILLLDMPDDVKPRSMMRYLHDTPLPDVPSVTERIGHLLGIADALRTSFPLNEQMGAFWLNRNNKRFAHRKPIDIMLNDGLPGILSIRMHLDCAYDWHIDASSSKE